mgnify:FL=1
MKIGFLGCGSMGGAIARAVSQVTKDIVLTDRSGRGKALADQLGVAYGSAKEIARDCGWIFLAVKPQMMEAALSPIQEILQEKKPLLVTMAAGLSMEKIETMAGGDLPVIRMMPNTPAMVGAGMTQYCCNSLVTEENERHFLSLMAHTGHVDKLNEGLIDAASALSGCGPAYMYLFLEGLADGAVACGIPRAKAYEYAAATMEGAAKLMLTAGQHPGQLKDAVCSPGGSTIQGVRVLEEKGLRAAAMDCVIAAFEKSRKLGG